LQYDRIVDAGFVLSSLHHCLNLNIFKSIIISRTLLYFFIKPWSLWNSSSTKKRVSLVIEKQRQKQRKR